MVVPKIPEYQLWRAVLAIVLSMHHILHRANTSRFINSDIAEDLVGSGVKRVIEINEVRLQRFAFANS